MEKKRIAILAVILFLLIGFGTFVFANPSQEENRLEEKEESGKVVREEKDDDDKSDTDITETTDNSETALVDADTTGNEVVYRTTTRNGDNGGNSGTIPDGIGGTDVDNSYTKALEAVIKAENSLAQNDVNTAADLVEKVTDAGQRQELMDRLDKVQDIIDATALVEQLEKLVNEATNKNDMNGARDYREDSKVEEIVAALTNSDSKTDLTNRLEKLAGILNDTDAPKVSTSPAQEVTKHDVTLSVEDDNKVTIVSKLNGQVIENPETYTEEGVYEVTVTDAAFNEKTIKFVIDRTVPVVIGATNGGYYREDVTLDIIEENLQNAKYRKDGGKWYSFESGHIFTEEGTYEIKVTDKSYNKKAELTFTIDKTAPEVLSMEQVYEDKEGGRIKVTITTSEEIFGDQVHAHGWRKVGENTYVNYYYGTKDVTFNFIDKAGNPGVYNFTVDKTAPTVKVTKSNNDKSTNKDVIVTIEGNEPITIEGWTKVNDTTYTNVYSENGKYSVVVKDVVGNATTVNFEVKRIDKVAPTAIITKSNNDNSTNQDVVVTLVSNEAIYKPEGWTEVKTNKEHEFTKTYSKNGKYSVVIKDKAGNETTINFEVKRIDKVAPKLTVVDPNKYYLEAGEPYVDKGYSAYDEVDKDVTHLVRISYQFLAEGTSNWTTPGTLDTTKLGTYRINYTAYDKAGNTAKGSRVVVIRDTTKPKFIGLEEGGIYNPATIQVEDATLKTISVYSENDKTVTNVENGYVINQAGRYTITAVDQKGNTETITITVDTSVPTYTFNAGTVEYNNVYGILNLKLHDENGIASVVINGTQLPHTGYYVDINDGHAYTFQNGENTVVVTDAAGNEVTYTFIVDKKAPTYTISGGTTEHNGVYGTLNLKLHDENGIASVVINGTQLPHTGYYVDINDGHAYTFQNGVNTVVVTDNLGNTATYTFNVDKEAPTYVISAGSIENNGAYEKLNLQLRDPNGIASVMINGTQLPHAGNYVDINDGHAYTFQNGLNKVFVKDSLGNSTTYEFNVIK